MYCPESVCVLISKARKKCLKFSRDWLLPKLDVTECWRVPSSSQWWPVKEVYEWSPLPELRGDGKCIRSMQIDMAQAPMVLVSVLVSVYFMVLKKKEVKLYRYHGNN